MAENLPVELLEALPFTPRMFSYRIIGQKQMGWKGFRSGELADSQGIVRKIWRLGSQNSVRVFTGPTDEFSPSRQIVSPVFLMPGITIFDVLTFASVGIGADYALGDDPLSTLQDTLKKVQCICQFEIIHADYMELSIVFTQTPSSSQATLIGKLGLAICPELGPLPEVLSSICSSSELHFRWD